MIGRQPRLFLQIPVGSYTLTAARQYQRSATTRAATAPKLQHSGRPCNGLLTGQLVAQLHLNRQAEDLPEVASKAAVRLLALDQEQGSGALNSQDGCPELRESLENESNPGRAVGPRTNRHKRPNVAPSVGDVHAF